VGTGETMTIRLLAAFILMAVVGFSFAQLHAQNQEKFKARLSTIAMDGGMRETVAGTGSASAVLAGTKLTINGTFEGLRSPATVARVHSGLAMGVRGAAISDLTVAKATNGTISGSLDLTPEQVQGLKAGRLYIQISSEKAPEGNLWGWLVR
jgi:hypothetical protein